jgi:hypothetical protein
VGLLTGEKATRGAVLSALEALSRIDDAEATVVVYFSGHGYRVTASLGEFYYLMPFGYDTDRLFDTAIRGDEFTFRLRAIPAQKLLVLLDCCHAGGLTKPEPSGMKLAKAPLPPEAAGLLAEGRGRVLIASSQQDELSSPETLRPSPWPWSSLCGRRSYPGWLCARLGPGPARPRGGPRAHRQAPAPHPELRAGG